jgi:hypothetical protein
MHVIRHKWGHSNVFVLKARDKCEPRTRLWPPITPINKANPMHFWHLSTLSTLS